MKCSLFSVFVVMTIRSASSSFCYWNTGCPYKYLATRTPYSAVRGDLRDTLIKIKGCEPISIWGFFRHGKTYPPDQIAKNMKDVLFLKNYFVTSSFKGNSSLCAQDVENLLYSPVNDDMFQLYDYLTKEGQQEMDGIGKRLHQTFPTLLNDLKDKDITLRSTNELWVENSVKAFLKGLGNEKINVGTSPEEDVKLVSPDQSCEKYTKGVRLSTETSTEEDKYVASPEYLAAKDRIQRRTGLNITLTNAQVQALYDLCRYTWSGIDNKPSPWCATFTTDDLKIFEYQEDLREYYENSYGHPISKKLGYTLAGNLLKSFKDVIDGRGNKIVANFGGNKILSMLYTAFGLYKDNKLLTSTKRDPGRSWRSSKLAAFSANFVSVLYRCKTNNSMDYNVVFYQNEEPLGSICPKGICSWQEFEDIVAPFANSTLDFCTVDPHK